MKNKLYLLCILLLLVIGCQLPYSQRTDFSLKKQVQILDDFIDKQQLALIKKGNGLAVSNVDLSCDCHVQGIGWASSSRQMVLTCQDLCAEKSGAYLLLYQENQLLPIDVVKGAADAFFNHPSAIQITKSIFPVAFAAERGHDSFIEFYEIQNNYLKKKANQPIHVKGKHIGALAYASFDDYTYLIGVGWDAEDLTIWKAAGENATNCFVRHFYSNKLSSLFYSDNLTDWGSYNSLWLGKTRNNKVVLAASHGKKMENSSSLDIWEIKNIANEHPKFQLISKKKYYNKTDLDIHYFHEGVTFKTIGVEQDSVTLLAAPHDFTTANCPQGFRCSNAIYEFKTY